MTRKKAPHGLVGRGFLAVPALASLAWAGVAGAETTIGSGTTAPVATSTANAGAPGDITITSDGSVKPASGVAVTLDSDNSVVNSGSIVIRDVNGTTGILALGGHTGSITNNSIVQIDESNAIPTTGAFATGSNRYGIHLTGLQPLTGSITNAGTITVIGNDSSGISAEPGLIGSLVSSGAVTVTGDRTFAIRTGGAVTGDVTVRGATSATGLGATGVQLGGDVGGGVVVESSLFSTGYRTVTRSTVQSVLDALTPSDLLQGGSTLVINGNVGRGLLIDTQPTLDSANTDVNGNGVLDTSEGVGAVTSYGSAPAVVIGAVGRTVTLGDVGTGADAYGVVIRGSVSGLGVYDGFSATGLQLGVAGGGAVNVSDGVRIQGSLAALAYKADATALHILSGVRAGEIWNQGSLASTMNGDTSTSARGVLIEAGAQVTRLHNTGTLDALVSGVAGDAVAVRDLSGSLISIENSKTISALVIPTLSTETATGKAIAIDVSANTSGVAIQQDNGGDTSAAPAITGSILFGSGSDDLKVLAGSVTGDIVMGAGANALTIDGGATVKGGLTASGGTLALAIPNGALTITSPSAISLTSFQLGSTSTLKVSADPTSGTFTQLNVAGVATIGSGAKIGIELQSLLKGQASYTILKAGSLVSGAIDTSLIGSAPYLYNASLSTDAAAGAITIDIARKTAAQLALPTSTAAAYEPLIAALDKDAVVRDAFLAQTTRVGLMKAYNQMLPNHSGGVFEAVSAQADATARAIDDRQGAEAGGAWLQETSVVAEQDGTDDAPGYRASGFNVSGGQEWGAGSLGVLGATLSLGSMQIKDDNASAAENLSVNRAEAGGYWRFVAGRLVLNARLAGSYISASSRRSIYIYDDSDALLANRSAKGDWSGWAVNGRLAAAYEGRIGGLYARPTASLDYLRLEEGDYSEKNGGDAVDLHVSARQSSRSTGFAGVVTGARYGDQDGWWGPEMTLGYRAIGQAQIGSTTAQFQSGTDSFTLLADQIKGGGMVARVALKGETTGGAFAVEGGAETRDSLAIYDLRLAAHFRF